MTYRTLLVEDDAQIREIIEDYFRAQSGGMEIVSAGDGHEGALLAAHGGFDLILLDIMLPGRDGFSLCKEIRSQSDVPILFLTARSREEDLLHGYALGCDDYIVKPFSPAALYAKSLALLRRSKGLMAEQALVCGGIRLELRSLQVTADGRPVTLAPKELAMLQFLMEHKNWVVTRDMLLDRIWGMDFFGSDRVVDTHIKKLRRALGSAGTQIRTVVSRGYKLTDTPEKEDQP
ncbi:MAG: response regulator transcription factor [Oscillospiraceae bacterium]|nr:response regulator transcription factor [Oscillospiraceae bacterium]